ncbi:MAG: hypothetical protein NC131_12245, partial [Roseburia sp.]|nr:hypothetical protein [Roseburia sp.]
PAIPADPEPVADQKVEPPTEDDAVPAPADAEGADLSGADQGETVADTYYNIDGDESGSGDAGSSDIVDITDPETGSEETSGDAISANDGVDVTDLDDTSAGASQSTTTDTGMSMEELLASLGGGSSSGSTVIVPQSGGVSAAGSSGYSALDSKLTRDEENQYGTDAVVQTAVLTPEITSSGSMSYIAYFGVEIADTDLATFGMAYFIGTATVPNLPDSDSTQTDVDKNDDDDKTDEGEKLEDPADDKGDTPEVNKDGNDQLTASPYAAGVADPTDWELRDYGTHPETWFNLNNRGPGISNDPAAALSSNTDEVYYIRVFVEEAASEQSRYDVARYLQTSLAKTTLGQLDPNVAPIYSVLDPRVATISASGVITPKSEGRTAVYAKGKTVADQDIYAVLQLEVRSRFYLSSGAALTGNAADGYTPKLAIPMISAGSSHSLALKADGSVWGWGNAPEGTFALGEDNSQLSSPAPINIKSSNGISAPLSNIVMVSAGLNFSLALSADGYVYGWGSNSRGQTGVGEDPGTTTSAVQNPTRVVGVRKADGTPDYDDANTDADGYLYHIVAISAGASHALALAADGTVYAWGDGTQGQLGVVADNLAGGTDRDNDGNAYNFRYSSSPVMVRAENRAGEIVPLKGIVSIAAGGSVSVALSYEGSVYTWGDNRRGQLGRNLDPATGTDNENFYKDTAKMLETAQMFDKTAANRVFTQNNGYLAISAGGQSATTQKSYGHVLAIRAILDKTAAGDVIDSTLVYGWGANGYGQVGDDSDAVDASKVESTHVLLPTEVRYKTSYMDDTGRYYIGNRTVSVAAGTLHSLGVVQSRPQGVANDNQDIYYTYGWGYDDRGQLAQGDASANVNTADGSGASQQRNPIRLLAKAPVADSSGNAANTYVVDSAGVSAGNAFSIYWDINGEVFGSGYNFTYQLGAEPALTSTFDEKTGTYLEGNEEVVKLPVRVGYGVSQNLIYDKVWVYTTMTDEDTGEVSTMLTARYAVQPETVPQAGDPGDPYNGVPADWEIASNVASIPVSKLVQTGPTDKNRDKNMPVWDTESDYLNELQYNALHDVTMQFNLTLTNQQHAVVFKDGIKRYYSVGFNVSERDRAVPSAEDSTMLYGYVHEDELPNLEIVDTKDKQEPYPMLTKNNAVLLPTELKDVFTVMGVVEDANDWEEKGVYAGKIKVTIEDANNFATPMVKAGENFTVALKSDGTVWAWGDNTYGQLGTGYTYEQLPYAPYPMRVAGVGPRDGAPIMQRLTLIKEIAAGNNHAMARTADGSIYAWGDNSRGQLGQNEDVYETFDVLGDTANVVMNEAAVAALKGSCFPVQVSAGTNSEESGSNYIMGATAIGAGGYHSMAVVGEDGWVYTWGDNTRSQLGTGYAHKAIGDMRTYPDRVIQNRNGETPEKKYLTDATSVTGGTWSSYAIGPFPYATSGSGQTQGDSTYVAVWGDNRKGQLGLGPDITLVDGEMYQTTVAYMRRPTDGGDSDLADGITQIAAGEFHAVAMTTGGMVYAMGDYSHGQLGKVGALDSMGYGYIGYAYSLSDEKGPISDALGVAAGKYHTVILRGTREGDANDPGPIIESRIYVMGTNTNGQIGVPAVDAQGYYHSETISGQNVGETYNQITLPDNISGVVTSMSAGGAHTVALTDLGEVLSWGKNETGQLGEMSLIDRNGSSQSGFDDAYIPVVSGVVNYGGALKFDVRMETWRNGVRWDDLGDGDYNQCDYVLWPNVPTNMGTDPNNDRFDLAAYPYRLIKHTEGGHTYYDSINVDGYTPSIPGGSYNIWSLTRGDTEWKDTGAEVKVTKGVNFKENPARIDFFKVNFSAVSTNKGTATIEGWYTVGGIKSKIKDGDSVWGGGLLELKAMGYDGEVPDYTYTWTTPVIDAQTEIQTEVKSRYPDDPDSSKRATVDGYLTIPELTGQIEIVCSVYDPELYDVTLRINKDNSPWADSGKQLFLKSDYRTIELMPWPEVDSTKTDGSYYIPVQYDGDTDTWNRVQVPEGNYTIWEYNSTCIDETTGARMLNLCFESPNVVTVKGGDTLGHRVDYYSLKISAQPINGVSMAYVTVSYAKVADEDGEDRYTPMNNWRLDGGVVMKDAPLMVQAIGTVCSGFFTGRVSSTWDNHAGTASSNPQDFATLTGFSPIPNRDGSLPNRQQTLRGTTSTQVYRANGNLIDLKVTMDGMVAGDSTFVRNMRIQVTVNDPADATGRTTMNWPNSGDYSGYEFYAESQNGRSGAEKSGNRTWASYKLTYRGNGIFDAEDLGGLPRDRYMIYMVDTNATPAVKIPVNMSDFNLTQSGYTTSANPSGADPATSPLQIPLRRVNYQVSTRDDSGSGAVGSEGYIQVISGINSSLPWKWEYDVDDGLGHTGTVHGESANGRTQVGMIIADPENPDPSRQATVVKNIKVTAGKNATDSFIVPVNNLISVQAIGAHADYFTINTQWYSEGAYLAFHSISSLPANTPMTSSTEAGYHVNLAEGSAWYDATIDFAWDWDDNRFTGTFKPIGMTSNAQTMPMPMDTLTRLEIGIIGYGNSLGNNYPQASLSSLDMLEQVEEEDFYAAYTYHGDAFYAQAQLAETTPALGSVIQAEIIVPDRDLANWEKSAPEMADLSLGNSIELITGDTVDIVGSIETYIPDYRLAYLQTYPRYYRNITEGEDLFEQPYIQTPDEIVDGPDKDEMGNPIPIKNPDRFIYAGYDEEGNPLTDADGNILYEDLWKDARLVIISSNPDIVTVKNYTLTAMAQSGWATVRVYNQLTGRSAMLRVHVLNADDASAKGMESEWAYKATPMIAYGDNFSVALKADGTVWTWGSNSKGQLGTGYSPEVLEYSEAPMAVHYYDAATDSEPTLRNVVAIAAGAEHAVALTRDGEVYIWGDNNFGQMGVDRDAYVYTEDRVIDSVLTTVVVGYGNYYATPADISGVLGKILEVAAGDGFTVVRTERNTVWAWGRNDKGQLGNGYQGDVLGADPVRAANIIRVTDPDLYTNLIHVLFPESVNSTAYLSQMTQRYQRDAVGLHLDSYYLYIKYLYDVSVFVGQQQTGLGGALDGMYEADGTLTYPLEDYRGNEMPTMETYILALELYDRMQNYLAGIHAQLLGSDAVGADYKAFNRFVPVANAKKDGVIVFNTEWELARPTYSGVKWNYEDYLLALEQFEDRKNNGKWISVNGGYANAASDTGNYPVYESEPTFGLYTSVPQQVMEGEAASKGYYLSEIISISAGKSHVMALRSDGSLFGWGDNTYGQLGRDVDSKLILSDKYAWKDSDQGEGVKALYTRQNKAADELGATFTYRVPVRVKVGTITDAMKNEAAEETYGNLINVMEVSAGGNHTLALLADGTVAAFGENTYGQIGNNEVDAVTYLVSELVGEDSGKPVEDWVTVYDLPQVKDAVQPRRIPMAVQARTADGKVLGTVQGADGSVNRAVKVAAGGNSSAAIVRDTVAINNLGDMVTENTIMAWGSDLEGQLGLDEVSEDQDGLRTAFAGHAKQVQQGTSSNTNKDYHGFTKAIEITVGGRHMGALRSDGYVWDWGANDFGQLGDGTLDTRYAAVQAGDGESKSLILSKYEHHDAASGTVHTYSQLRPVGEENADVATAALSDGTNGNPNIVIMGEGDYLAIDLEDLLYAHRTGFNLYSDGENLSIQDKLDMVQLGVTDPSYYEALPVNSDATQFEIRPTQHSDGQKLGLTSVYIDYEFGGGTYEDGTVDPATSNMMVLPIWAKHKQTYDGSDPADPAAATTSAAPMVAAGAKHAVALDTLGRIWVWGDNTYGQLGIDPTDPDPSTAYNENAYREYPVQVTNFYQYNAEHTDATDPVLAEDGGPLTFTAVAAGDNFTVAVDCDGHVWTWGDNSKN